jgi:hypothetical protein
MTRLRRIETVNRIFFVTFKLERHVPPLNSSERSIVLNILHDLRTPNDFAIYGYVIMPTHKLDYIHDNPKAARLVDHPGRWPWSSYGYYQQKADLPIPTDKIDFMGDPNELLWPAPWRRL